MLETAPTRLSPLSCEIEAAIKLLQTSGYEVFEASAGVRLSAAHSIDNLYYDRHGGETGTYANAMRASLVTVLAKELAASDLITFTYGPVPPGSPAEYVARTQHRVTLEVFPSKRKTWRRR